MLKTTPASLAALAQIQTHTESDHPTLGSVVRMGVKDEEAFELLELLAEVVVGTGQVLRALGKRDLGQWVKEALAETNGDAGAMVHMVSFAEFKWRVATLTRAGSTARKHVPRFLRCTRRGWTAGVPV